jgi:DNA primase
LISKETIQQIQSRLDIVDVVSTFVKLKKRGTNYLGNCPFHNEKSPSFTVSPSKEIYKCFGCGKSGNSIGFVMDHEKYSYVEALRWLAAKYNVDIEETETSPEFKILQQASESLFIINHFARDYFSKALFELEEGIDIAMSYLKSRGFNEEIIKKFQLGYNPQARDGFTQAAISAQYNQELLIKTGLVANREDRLSDNYRGRIIFPIHNQSGKVLGFGARVIKSNDKAPKYINTPETEIYVKSKVLYGAYFAKSAIDKTNECLLVEGYTDVVSLHQAGIENVVASGGTSLTIEQLRLIKKYTKNLTIIYDGDGAGIKAALRGLDLAVEEGLEVKLVLIPDNEDPDSYVNKIGKEAFIEFVKNEQKDFILFQLEIALKDAKGDSAKKSAVVNQIAETISKINKSEDFTKRQDYIRNVSEILKIEEAGFNALVNNIIRNRISKEESKSNGSNDAEMPPEIPADFFNNADELLNKDERQEQALVRSLIEFGQKIWDENTTVANHIIAALDELEINQMIENKLLITIIEAYRTANNEGLSPNAKFFLYHEDETIKNMVIKLMEEETEISPNWKYYYQGYIATREDLYKEEVNSTLNYLQLRKIKKLMMENQAELEKTNDPEQQFVCIQVHQMLKKMEKEITQQTGMVIYK